MNPNFKLWLDRLRDPDARQARAALVDPSPDLATAGMCCLGHACYVASQAKQNGKPITTLAPREGNPAVFVDTNNNSRTMPSIEVAKWLGIYDHPACVGSLDDPDDPDGRSYWTIRIPAEVIKAYIPGLTIDCTNRSVDLLNDIDQLTLSQIADLLEATFYP